MLESRRILNDSPETKRAFFRWNDEMLAQNDPDLYLFSPWRVVRWVENARVRAVLRLLKAGSADRVLEVGCGSGQILNRVPALKKFGLDVSQPLLERARQNAPANQYIRGDAEALPFRDGTFERVLCSSVLSHVLTPAKVLREGFRMLSDAGRLVVSVPNADGIERGVKVAHALQLHRLCSPRDLHGATDRFQADYHLHRFTRRYLLDLAAFLPAPARVVAVPSRLLPLHLVALWIR